jgi:SAM-dependent methyltransferase
MSKPSYVHGYTEREAIRLNDQANTLDELLHHDTLFPPGALVLEAGCGVGAQTKIITRKNRDTRFVSVDISEASVHAATELARSLDIRNVEFQQADMLHLPFRNNTFDGVFVCFVLEHLPDPLGALSELKRVLKPGGKIMVIEGDHGSTFFHPDSSFAHQAIQCQVSLQKQHGGNSNIGRELYPLLNSAGYNDIRISPRMVYVDGSRPQLLEGFIKNTFTAMIEGVGNDAVKQGIIDRPTFDKGIRDLYRTAAFDGVFSYTFFKGLGIK